MKAPGGSPWRKGHRGCRDICGFSYRRQSPVWPPDPLLPARRPTGPANTFKKGERIYQQGEFRKALSEYKKAHQAKAHPAFIFNVAQCHRQLGEYKKALFFYRLYLSEAPKSPNRDEVPRRIEEMEQKVAELTRKEQQKGKVSVVTSEYAASVSLAAPFRPVAPIFLSVDSAGGLA